MNRATQIRQKRTLLLLAVSLRAQAEAEREALDHYWTGMRTFSSGVALDGWYVAQRMAEALERVVETEQEASR
jgi:hypothetical protein